MPSKTVNPTRPQATHTSAAAPAKRLGDGAITQPPPSDRLYQPKQQLMKPRQISVFGWAMVLVPCLLFSQLVALWPAALAATRGSAQPTVTWLFGLDHTVLNPDAALLLLVALVGALASLGEESFRFVVHAGRGDLSRRWTWFYALRPIQGAVLAVVVYFALRGGLLGTDASTPLNPYGLAGIAALVGLFTRQAFQKLRDVFDTLWGVDSLAADVKPEPDDPKAAKPAAAHPKKG